MVNNNSVETKFQWKNVGHQYYATISANLLTFVHGAVIGWIAPALPILLTESTPLKTGPLTTDEVSWIGSINSIGGIFGTLSFGYFTTKFGCKRVMSFLTIPSLIFWLTIYFGNSYYHLLFARFLTGLTGGGIQTTNILYVAEISNDSIRGKLGSMQILARNFGTLVVYIVGAYVRYEHVPYIFITIPIVYAILFMQVPNTPQYYLKNEQLQKAETALKYYKGYRGRSEEEKAAMNEEFERLKSIAVVKKSDDKIHLRDFFEKSAIKGLSIGFCLVFLAVTTGCITFINYAVYVFQKSGSHIDPYVSSIIIAVAQLVGNLCTTQLADTLGRKLTMLISILGCAVGLSVMTVYLYLVKLGYDLTAYAWLPVTSLSFVIFNGSAGVFSLTGVCTVENLPSKIRSIGVSLCSAVLYTLLFLSSKLFPIFVEIIGLHGCMFIFAVGCLLGSIFIIFVLDETKGISIDTLNDKEKNKDTV